ncbi:RsbRD N-terminal domain-containing protein [Candidatus Hydrogenedentota bacterium]
MAFDGLLLNRKKDIVDRWLRLICDTYPTETAKFLRSDTDRFANPIGHIFAIETERLFNQLLDGMDADQVRLSLDNIMGIQAVQDFKPSRAIEFVFLLKDVLREVAKSDSGDFAEDLREFESKIDALALEAFDSYTERREKLAEIRLNEMKRTMRRFNKKACGQ